MRVTNNMVMGNYLNNLYNNLSKMAKYQMQVATNKRITTISDDPIGVISSMETRTKLSRIQQYQENVDSGVSWLKQAESNVLELNDVVKSAYETAVRMANDYLTPQDKQASGELIGQLRDHVFMIANSKVGEKYIFSGYNGTTEPFTLDASGNILYNGLDLENDAAPALIAEHNQKIEYEVGFSMKAEISITGTKLLGMGEDNLYSVLDDLYNALQTNQPADKISEYISKLQNSQSHLMEVEAELGGRINRLELINSRFEDDFLNYTELKSSIEDVDLAEATMHFKMSEAVYVASLQIGSRIVQPTLVDFLK